VVSFFILPPLWEVGRQYRLQTQPDFFNARYDNKYLAGLVCVLGMLSFIPYVQLQLTGVGIIVATASFGSVGRVPAMSVAVVLLVAFVFANGVRAVAWVSVIKDFLILVAAVAIGIGIPLVHFGGIGPMFAALVAARPAHLTMPGATANLGHSWFISTVMLTSLGLYMWPQNFAATFTAKSADTLRRNAVVMPLYTLTLVFIFFVGFAAVLIAPGLSSGDLALLTVVRQSVPPWLLGIIGGAGALSAMVPASIFMLAGATGFAKNLYRPLFVPEMTDAQVARLARGMVIVLGSTSLVLAIYGSSTLVSLLLTGYAGVTQFFPGVVLGLYWRRAATSAVLAGIVIGVVTAVALMSTGRDPVFGLNAGFVALCLNFLVAVAGSLLIPARDVAPGRALSGAAAASIE
jgi:SSS family solute:Na+ symporter